MCNIAIFQHGSTVIIEFFHNIVAMRSRLKAERGVSLVEIVAVLVCILVLSSIAVPDFLRQSKSASNSANQIVELTRRIRAKALQDTLAYTIQPSSATQIVVKYSNTCSSTTKTTDNSLGIKLISGTSLASTTWSVCFDSRGFSDTALSLNVNDVYGRSKTVQIVLGGAARKV